MNMKWINHKRILLSAVAVVVMMIGACDRNDVIPEVYRNEALNEIKLGIQPYGSVDQELIDSVAAGIRQYYGFTIEVLPVKYLPKSAFVNVKSPRYRADSLIRILRREKPKRIGYILGLTESPISTTKRTKEGEVKKPVYRYADWGIFGLGFRPGVSCVVSTYYFKTSNRKLFLERLRKICMHEVGHNLGLKHCETGERCVMRDAAETIKTIDNVDASLCKNCAAEGANP